MHSELLTRPNNFNQKGRIVLDLLLVIVYFKLITITTLL
jgi:hypothetical protein